MQLKLPVRAASANILSPLVQTRVGGGYHQTDHLRHIRTIRLPAQHTTSMNGTGSHLLHMLRMERWVQQAPLSLPRLP